MGSDVGLLGAAREPRAHAAVAFEAPARRVHFRRVLRWKHVRVDLAAVGEGELLVLAHLRCEEVEERDRERKRKRERGREGEREREGRTMKKRKR